MNKGIFIDRDGVINKFKPEGVIEDSSTWNYILSWDEFEFEDGVFEAFDLIYSRIFEGENIKPIIVSNQSCVGKDLIGMQDMIELFRRMNWEISQHTLQFRNRFFLDYYFCPHDTNENCACRKPKPGMLYKAAIEHNIDLSQSYMIGDSHTDIEAGMNAGIPDTQCLKIGEPQVCIGIACYPSLLAAVKSIFR